MRDAVLRRFVVRIVLIAIVPCLWASGLEEEDRKEIVAAYQRSLDALRQGDADAALAMDTPEWVSITVGQKPRTRQEIEAYVRRDIASMKPPTEWIAVWKPNYQRNGTGTGIQIYDLKLDGDSAVAFCVVASTRAETIDGSEHWVWRGSHVRDT